MALSTPSPRLHFEPDTIPVSATPNAEQAPALSSSTALARFEFESGRGNEGTKILMVEWEDEEEGSDGAKNMGDWEVSWEGKTTVLSARDGAEGKLHRLYFLLAPGASIPRIVKLSQVGGRTMQTNPLPAIFPPELGLTARQSGRKGVLHTIWAKKRISVLQKEIEAEMKTNGEGIGLEMAMQEKQWIEENFGVGPRIIPDLQQNATPSSPKTPGGGRLSEKLKGLKLGTSAADLSSSSEVKHETFSNPLSPEQGDVAVSSFSLFHGGATRPQQQQQRIIAQAPPIGHGQTFHSIGGMSSLNAVASGHIPSSSSSSTPKTSDETEDELFAVKMSPRSPEMTKSPFSFASKDVTGI